MECYGPSTPFIMVVSVCICLSLDDIIVMVPKRHPCILVTHKQAARGIHLPLHPLVWLVKVHQKNLNILKKNPQTQNTFQIVSNYTELVPYPNVKPTECVLS